MRSRPSGRQSIENGSPSTRATISRVPAASKARTSPAAQSHIQNRPSCHRGDSPIWIPVAKSSVIAPQHRAPPVAGSVMRNNGECGSAAAPWPQLAEGQCGIDDGVESDVDDEQYEPAAGGQAGGGQNAHGPGARTVAAFQCLERLRAMSRRDLTYTNC